MDSTIVNIRSQQKYVLRRGDMGIHLGVKVGGGTGGWQSFDRAKLCLAAADELRKLYPAIKFKATPEKQWPIEPVMKGPFYGFKKL